MIGLIGPLLPRGNPEMEVALRRGKSAETAKKHATRPAEMPEPANYARKQLKTLAPKEEGNGSLRAIQGLSRATIHDE